MKTWNPHYKSLDYWRGFAALWVMLFHGFGSSYDKSLHPLVEPLKSIAQLGWLGVHIFFVISGYCIAASAYKIVIKNKTPWDFIKNRILRLFPVYWLAFILTIVVNLVAAPFNNTGFWGFGKLNWLKFAGTMSYSLYLLHIPFQGRFINLGTRFISVDSIGYLFLQILGWAVAITVSYIFYTLVEKPLNNWRHKTTTTTFPKVLVHKN